MEPGSEKVNIDLCVRGGVGYKSIHQWKIQALDGYFRPDSSRCTGT